MNDTLMNGTMGTAVRVVQPIPGDYASLLLYIILLYVLTFVLSWVVGHCFRNFQNYSRKTGSLSRC